MMIAKLRRLGCLAAILLSPLSFCTAQDLNDPVVFVFTRNTVPLWNLSGDYSIVQQIKGADGQMVPLAFQISVTHDPKGQLTGTNTTIVQVGNNYLAGNYVARGRVSGGGPRPTRVNFTVNVNGQDYLSGQLTRFNISLTYKLQVDIDNLALVGTVKGHANFSSVSAGGPVNSEVVVPLHGIDTGAWLLTMNLTPLSHLTGVGTTTLSDGSVLNSTAGGSLSTKSGLAKVKLTGVDASRGTSANVQFLPTSTGNSLEKLRGKMYGQSIRYP